jgi:hypothetical protein
MPAERKTNRRPVRARINGTYYIEPCWAPLVHALPPEAQILLISRLNNNISDFSEFGKLTLKIVYRLFPNASPLNVTPEISFSIHPPYSS